MKKQLSIVVMAASTICIIGLKIGNLESFNNVCLILSVFFFSGVLVLLKIQNKNYPSYLNKGVLMIFTALALFILQLIKYFTGRPFAYSLEIYLIIFILSITGLMFNFIHQRTKKKEE